MSHIPRAILRTVVRPYETGELIDGWNLRRRLGQGGNCVVWQAERGGREFAVKFLRTTRATSERYRRFKDEIAVHQQLNGSAGVLPMVDHRLPHHPRRDSPGWLAMPIARRIDFALGKAPALELVVEAVAEIAETLASLAARKIAHRDLKPQNLFQLDGTWLVGDLGLAVFPGKETKTRTGRQVGARHFIAPEVVRDPENATPYAADVYSLAQTAYVLASRQRFPPDGGIRTYEQNARLRTYVEHQRVVTLDRALEQATASDPSERPTMADLASTLRTWLRGPPPGAAAMDLSDLADAAKRMARDAQNAAARRGELTAHADRLREQARAGMSEIGRSIEIALPGFEHKTGLGFDPTFISLTSRTAQTDMVGPIAYGFLAVHRFSLGWPTHVSLWTGIALRMDQAGRMLLSAGHVVGRSPTESVAGDVNPVVVMRDGRFVTVGTPEAEDAVGQQLRALAETSRAAVEQLLRLPIEAGSGL